MTRIYCRVCCKASGQEWVVVGRWLQMEFLPRIGEEVNMFLPKMHSADRSLTPVVAIEHWPDEHVVVVCVELDYDGGFPGSWARDSAGVDFREEVLQDGRGKFYQELTEDEDFPRSEWSDGVSAVQGGR